MSLPSQSSLSALSLEAIVSECHDAIITKSLDGKVTSWNAGAEKLFGYSSEERLGQTMAVLFPSLGLQEEEQILATIGNGQLVEPFRTTRIHKSGRPIVVSVSVSPIRNTVGDVCGVLMVERDVSSFLRQEHCSNHYEAIVNSADDAIISKSLDGTIETWNSAAEKMFGYKANEAIGQNIKLIFPKERYAEEEKLISSVLGEKPIRHFRTTRLHKDGRKIFASVSISPIFDAYGRVTGFSKIARDITKEIEHEKQFSRQINYDGLTGILNREGILNCVEELIQLSQVRGKKFALLSLNLDNFRAINERYGKAFGDRVLARVARELQCHIRGADEVGRLGGDEFLICLFGFSDLEGVKKAAQKVVQAVSDIQDVKGVNIRPTASVGISIFPEDGKSRTVLLNRANNALAQVKHANKNSYLLYSGVIGSELKQDNLLVQELKLALNNEELFLVFQPICHATDQRVDKVEVLVRWNHPELGFVPPDVFIPLAEKYGLISQIDEFVVRQALKHLSRWTGLFGMDFQVSINASPFSFFADEDSVNRIRDQLHEFGLKGENVVLEITEHSFLEDTAQTQKLLDAYHELGVKIAIDDFGTGYSSLTYLRKYPIDYLKIDKVFVSAIESNQMDYNLCQCVIELAKKVGIKVVTEGIETSTQKETLQSLESDYLQGYLFSKPLSEKALLEYMKRIH